MSAIELPSTATWTDAEHDWAVETHGLTKSFGGNVGQALSPVNTAIPANITASQRVGLHQ